MLGFKDYNDGNNGLKIQELENDILQLEAALNNTKIEMRSSVRIIEQQERRNNLMKIKLDALTV